MTSLLRLHRASFGYDQRAVVAGVDLSVDVGRFIGIVGPNGSGKTTLVRGLLGLLAPLAGTVDRRGASIGYVPQRETLDPLYPLTTQEVVEMGAYRRLSGWRALADADREEAERILARVGLTDLRRARFSSLSGGQRQRALIARALLTRPNLLLLDEPTSGVDRQAQVTITALLRTLQSEGLAILLVSHQLGLVREAADQLLVVCGGRARIESPEVLADPLRLDELFGAPSPTEE